MVVTFIYCCYYAIVRPFNYQIQNIVVILNECLIFAIAGLFCGFLSEGDPNKDLAFAIIIVFSVDIIGCFMLGLGFQIYLIKSKYERNKEGIIVPMTKNTTENNGNARNDTQQKLKTLNYLDGDDELEQPAKLTYRGDFNKSPTKLTHREDFKEAPVRLTNREDFKEAPVRLTHIETFKKSIPFQHSNRYIESVKAGNTRDNTTVNTKHSNQDTTPSIRFQRTTVEMGRDKVIDKINLFGGNLQDF
jgi:hypothetical protein